MDGLACCSRVRGDRLGCGHWATRNNMAHAAYPSTYPCTYYQPRAPHMHGSCAPSSWRAPPQVRSYIVCTMHASMRTAIVH